MLTQDQFGRITNVGRLQYFTCKPSLCHIPQVTNVIPAPKQAFMQVVSYHRKEVEKAVSQNKFLLQYRKVKLQKEG